jgi:ATP-dependent DNA helicase UvrD/PcrA
MAEIHKRAIDGDIVSGLDADDLVDKHLNIPFAYPALRTDLRRAAIQAVRRYVEENRTRLENTLYFDQQIQVRVAPGITVDGRIDLITRLDTGETSIDILVLDMRLLRPGWPVRDTPMSVTDRPA